MVPPPRDCQKSGSVPEREVPRIHGHSSRALAGMFVGRDRVREQPVDAAQLCERTELQLHLVLRQLRGRRHLPDELHEPHLYEPGHSGRDPAGLRSVGAAVGGIDLAETRSPPAHANPHEREALARRPKRSSRPAAACAREHNASAAVTKTRPHRAETRGLSAKRSVDKREIRTGDAEAAFLLGDADPHGAACAGRALASARRTPACAGCVLANPARDERTAAASCTRCRCRRAQAARARRRAPIGTPGAYLRRGRHAQLSLVAQPPHRAKENGASPSPSVGLRR